jgi:hypothetical protein
MINQYASIETLLAKLDRDYKDHDFAESDVIEWAGEALEFIGAVPQYEEAVAFIEVKNFQAAVPSGTHAIIQIARNTCWTPQEKCICPQDVVETLTDEEGVHVPVALDCNGTPVNAYELAYYRPYFDLQAEFGNWSISSLHERCFSPVRLSDHTFFNSVVCMPNEATGISLEDLYSNCQDEYTLTAKGKIMRFSFQEGMVAVSYTRQCVDENGFPMIPDHTSFLTAITAYIRLMHERGQFYKHRQGSSTTLQYAEQQWHWYCKQAGNQIFIPQGVDGYQSILEQRQYLLPNMKRYYGFFGKMARPEDRKFNDPDSRNNYRRHR